MVIKKIGNSASASRSAGKSIKLRRAEAPARYDQGVTIVGVARSAGVLTALQSFFDEWRGQHTPIEFFFGNLVAAHRDAVAIILPGGTHGAVVCQGH
jgi:hypothetical protein